jgi:hypothetical protein
MYHLSKPNSVSLPNITFPLPIHNNTPSSISNVPTSPAIGSSPSSTNPSLLRLPVFSRIESQNYFNNNKTDNLGPASLIAMAHFKKKDCAHLIPPEHVYNQILIAQHASYLTKGQKKNFAHLLHNLVKNGTIPQSSSISMSSECFIPSIPTTFADIRSKCTEGANSVVMNLPYPAIQTDVPNHCYVKISDVIEDFLAHGFLPLQPSMHQVNDWISTVSQSPLLVSSIQKATAMYGHDPFFFLAFKEWQDDYESQYAKTDRGSVWCKNMTIIAEPGTPKHFCTYPIAFSHGQHGHHAVERELEKDM